MPSATSSHTRVDVSRLHAQPSACPLLLQNAALSTAGRLCARNGTWVLGSGIGHQLSRKCVSHTHSHFLPMSSSRFISSVKPFLLLWPTLAILSFEFLWHYYYFQLSFSLSLFIRDRFRIVFDHFHVNFPSSLGTKSVSWLPFTCHSKEHTLP